MTFEDELTKLINENTLYLKDMGINSNIKITTNGISISFSNDNYFNWKYVKDDIDQLFLILDKFLEKVYEYYFTIDIFLYNGETRRKYDGKLGYIDINLKSIIMNI